MSEISRKIQLSLRHLTGVLTVFLPVVLFVICSYSTDTALAEQQPGARPARPSDSALSFEARNKKAIEELIKFYKENGNTSTANTLREYYDRGSVVFEGNETYHRLGTIHLPEHFGLSVIDIRGNVIPGGRAAIAGTLRHELIHAGQGILGTAIRSKNDLEREAYSRTLADNYRWANNAKKELESKRSAAPCEQKETAVKMKAAANEFLNYYGEIKPKSAEARPGREKTANEAIEKLRSERAALNAGNLYFEKDKLEKEIEGLRKLPAYQTTAREQLSRLEPKLQEISQRIGSIERRQSEIETSINNYNDLLDEPYFDLKTLNTETDNPNNPQLYYEKDKLEKELAGLRKLPAYQTTAQEQISRLEMKLQAVMEQLGVKALPIEDAVAEMTRLRDEADRIVKACDEEKDKKEKSALKDCSSLVDKEKSSLFGDLCRCSCNSGVGGGATYDAAEGCVCSGVIGGKWTVGMITSGGCFKSSAAAVGTDAESCRKPVTEMNRQWAEKLIQKARDLVEDFWTALPGLGQGKKGEKGASETQKERVERKLAEGDLDKAAAYTKSAAEMHPPLESTAKAVIPGSLPWRLTNLALSFVPPLEFGTSRRLLERTSRLDETNQQVKENLAKVVQWEKEWNQIKSLSGDCFSLIEAKRPCECQRLFDGRIEPLNKSFRILTGNLREGRVLDDGRTIMERAYLPIPEKDALRLKLVLELDTSRRNCRYQPGLSETVSRLESYTINKAGPGLSDQAIADMAKKVLERKGLCDCEREVAEKALEIAQEGIAAQGPPLAVSIRASKTLMKMGETITVVPAITGGSPPYSFTYRGYWGFDVINGGITGSGQTPTSLRAKITGTHPLEIVVKDSKGKSASGRIDLTVETGTGPAIKPPASPPSAARLDITVMAEKSMLSPGEHAYVTASVSGGRPSYKVRWKGAVKGEGTNILFRAKKPGLQTITAEVSDAAGNRASGSVTITVGQSAATSVRKPPADAISSPPRPPKKPPLSNGGYNIFDDPNIKTTKDDPVDTDRVIKHGDEFQSGPGKKKTGTQTAPVSQPDTYIGKTTPQQGVSTTGSQYPPAYPPVYPPGHPPADSGSRTKGWTNWPNNKGVNSGGHQGEKPYTPPKAPPADSGTGANTVPGPGQLTVQAILKNTSKADVHIFAEKLENFSPKNKLAPGKKRTVSLKIGSGDGQLRFIAGRNGQKLANCSWAYLGGDISGRYPVVTFTGEEKLLCTTGLR
ncbi:MAG: PKD domain-containing protein [Thermodesulfovibrionales bacterium]